MTDVSSSVVTTPPPRFVNENDPHVFPSGAVASVTGRSWGENAYEQSGHGSYVVVSTTGRVSGFGSFFWLSFPFSLNVPTTLASVEITPAVAEVR